MRAEKDILKIKAVLLYMLNKFDEKVDFIKLFKLLYLAQKEHLRLYGIPLIKDDFYTFKAGPAPSIIYNICKFAKGECSDKSLELIAKTIQVTTEKDKKVNFVKALENPDMNRLSKSNLRVIDDIYDKYQACSSSKLSNITHDAAWRKNWNEDEKKPKKIPINDIVLAAGVSDGMRKYIQESLLMNGMS